MLARNALEAFVRDYADRAFRFAYGLCGDAEESRELVQGAFVRAFEKADRFDAAQPLENWFFTLLRNLHYDRRRRWENRPRVSLDAPVGDEGLTVADGLADAREEALIARLEREEEAGRVRAALGRLPDEWRALVILVDCEGAGYEEAARALGCPLGTVRSRLSRAREALRRDLLREVGA